MNQPWNDWNTALEKVKKVPGIAAAPYINFTGLRAALTCARFRSRALIRSRKPTSARYRNISSGDARRNFKAGEQQIILGKGVADALKVQQGDWVSIMIPNSDDAHKLLQPKRVRLHVTGILQLSGQLDHGFAMILMADAQQYRRWAAALPASTLRSTMSSTPISWYATGEVTNSYVYIKAGSANMAICIATSR